MSVERDDLPTDHEDGVTQQADTPDEAATQPGSGDQRTLVDDIEDLVRDARTYLNAELSYQKTRATFVGQCIKQIVAFGFVALLVAIFALIGLTVGLILALTPLITAWGATAVVVGVMLLAIFLLLRNAAKTWGELMAAIKEDEEG